MTSASEPTGTDRIDDVAPGDLVAVDRGAGERPYKVVHKADDGGAFLVTFEADDGATFQVSYPAGTVVARSLQAKWESPQSGG